MRTLLLAAVLLSGCAMYGGHDRRRSAYLQSRPDIAPEMRWAIADGKIRQGMTKEEVIASWGEPCWYCRGTREASFGDTWEYNVFGSGSYGAGNGTYLFFDPGGKLRHWSN